MYCLLLVMLCFDCGFICSLLGLFWVSLAGELLVVFVCLLCGFVGLVYLVFTGAGALGCRFACFGLGLRTLLFWG